jgi:hypothetical protein
MSEIEELKRLLIERFDRIDARQEKLETKLKAAHDIIEHQSKRREDGDEKLGRSLDRLNERLDAVSRAQGVQATKVKAICEKLGIRESLHDASEPPKASGSSSAE